METTKQHNGQEIESIHSSVSMQPYDYTVGKGGISVIKYEYLDYTISGDIESQPYYVAYDMDGNRLLQMLARTTNVHYSRIKID